MDLMNHNVFKMGQGREEELKLVIVKLWKFVIFLTEASKLQWLISDANKLLMCVGGGKSDSTLYMTQISFK